MRWYPSNQSNHHSHVFVDFIMKPFFNFFCSDKFEYGEEEEAYGGVVGYGVSISSIHFGDTTEVMLVVCVLHKKDDNDKK